MPVTRRQFTGTLLAASLGWQQAMAQQSVSGTAQSRRRTVRGIAELIEARYVYPDIGARVASALRRRPASSWSNEDDSFARAMTSVLHQLSGDRHFGVTRLANEASSESASQAALFEEWYGSKVNHGFESVQRLENGIGYLDVRVFAPVGMGGDLASAAMSLLASAPALIIDLRRNGGGMGEMVALLCSYLFDERRELSGVYSRPTDQLSRLFTTETPPGRRFGGTKPVFVLTSPRTFSAAEHFAYDLQAMRRAKIIGERTGGGAHPYEDHRVEGGFTLSLPESRSVSPITGKDWEGVGVTPDVETASDDALGRAVALALGTDSR